MVVTDEWTSGQAALASDHDCVERAAEDAGLRYVTGAMPGIRRRRAGRGFSYLHPNGHVIRDRRELARVKALAIPPAWTDVWICPLPNGHIQATGRDAKGRKQYRYHADWRAIRDQTKFGRMVAFGEALPAIRERASHDLSLPGLPRAKVLATIIRLLDTTLIRVGNAEYARENNSFGLTTMRDRHVAIDGSRVEFRFRGKSGKEHVVDVRDRRLANVVKRCRDLPGYELFQYIDDDGQRRAVGSADVNAYLREISGDDFTAKDFRTWAGTVLACARLLDAPPPDTKREADQRVVEVVKAVAERLGNTPAVCRKCYVHPAVIERYLDGELPLGVARGAVNGGSDNDHDLEPGERFVLDLLRAREAR